MLDFKNTDRAIYLQIADDIADQVVMGKLEPEARIPSMREYAATVMVNVNTVMRAYEHLTSHGIIYNKRGLGYFVAPDAIEKIKTMQRIDFTESGVIFRIFKRMHQMGFTPDEVAELYRKYIEQ